MIVCRPGVAVKIGPEGEHVAGFWCKRWSCTACAPRRRKQLVQIARSGDPTSLLTVTLNPAQHPDPIAAAQALAIAWRALWQLIRRRFPGQQLAFFRVMEKTRAGVPHAHVLLRAPFIPQKWLSEHWQRLTGSKIVDIRHIDNPGRAGAYLAKYIGKEPAQFGTCKRYSQSSNYRVGPKWTPPPRAADDGWLIDHYWTAAAWAAWRARDGWHTVEVAPGVYDCFRPQKPLEGF